MNRKADEMITNFTAGLQNKSCPGDWLFITVWTILRQRLLPVWAAVHSMPFHLFTEYRPGHTSRKQNADAQLAKGKGGGL